MRLVRRFAPAMLAALICASVVPAQSPAPAQSPPPRDARAIAALQQAQAALGGSTPADMAVSGTVALAAGSSTESGTFSAKARGADQSSEEIRTGEGTRTRIFSRGMAAEESEGNRKAVPLELAATSQSSLFPLQLLAALAADPESAFEYIGLEKIGDAKAHHVRVWKTYASRPKVIHLAEFSMRDVWVDAKTGLPLKISHEERAGGGAMPRVAVEITYSDYRDTNGVQVPHRIEKSLNGTLWLTVEVSQVSINTGLTDAGFSVPGVRR